MKVLIVFSLAMLVAIQPLRVLSLSIRKHVAVKEETVTLDFKKISIRELLEFFAEQTNYNIILDESVVGAIALHLKEVSWNEAFDAVLQIAGLAKQVRNNVIYVATPTNFARRQQIIQQAALYKTVKIRLKHIDAKQAVEQVKMEGQLLTSLAKIACNLQENSLWIKESVDNLPIVVDYLHKLDMPGSQILIAAKIVNLDDKQKSELGIKFSSDCNDNKLIGPHDVALNNFPLAIISLAQNRLLNLELEALEKEGHSHTVADPTIVTQNRRTATIEAGEDIPYQEKTSSGATSVTFKKAALSLKVTPIILPDNRIILELEINQNKVLPLSVNGTPVIQTQELKTQVVVHSDEGVILGGIYETEHAKVISGLPLLNQVPAINALVTHNQNEQLKKELFIVISPHRL